MSNTVHHTHRRAMRTVTPVSRAGRAGAGAAMAAAMLFGGAAAATAEPQAEAPQADAAAPAVIPAVAAPAVGIPAANAGDDEDAPEPALAPAPESTISVRSAAMTGMPPMRCSFMRRSASPTVFSLKMVTGS